MLNELYWLLIGLWRPSSNQIAVFMITSAILVTTWYTVVVTLCVTLKIYLSLLSLSLLLLLLFSKISGDFRVIPLFPLKPQEIVLLDADAAKFYRNLSKLLRNDEFGNEENIIIGGDFNRPLDITLDKKRRSSVSSKICNQL